jgi:methylase of polypeptide subunit release factors
MSHQAAVLTYLQNVKRANTEEAKKQHFYILLTEFFNTDANALVIIKQMAAGAEQAIFNIPKSGRARSKTGRADTQFRQVIIEFENDIKNNAKREHAEYQLKEYFAGNFNTSSQFDFYLIATDCVRWNIYGPTPESYLDKTQIAADDVTLKVVDSFVLNDANADDFFGFIDRYLFRSGKQVPTLDTIQIDFGDSSALFMEVFGGMKLVYDDIAGQPEIQTAFREWIRFMSVAYGSFTASGEVFLVHTYLSVFSKLIAYQVLSRDNNIDTAEMRGALDGSIFQRYNVENFVENDFYQWITVDAYFHRLKRYFSKIADKISEYDFTNVQSDILKGVYQKLIDLETRHALGEYYTPDWLCEKVVDHFDFARDAQILDPSCGSGSFLIATVNRLRKLHPDLPPEAIAAQVAGIDIHPLSVQVAKTTLLLALGDALKNARRPVSLRVYLANSLITPQLSVNLFDEEFGITIDEKRYYLPTGAFDDPTLFDYAISVADGLAADTAGGSAAPLMTLTNAILNNYPQADHKLLSQFYGIYLALKQAKETGRDSIWKFILQNIYKPVFLKHRFDYVIGNPPWFTYNSVKNAEYQQLLRVLATKYDLIPAKKALMPQLEIAAIFMSHVSSYLLREKAKMAFVLPRSFLSATQHDNTRSASAKGFRLTDVWDLKDVKPLFNVPSCVLFAQQANVPKSIPATGLPGLVVAGNMRRHNSTFSEVSEKLTFMPMTWYLARQQKGSALTTVKPGQTALTTVTSNFYREHFRNGATMFPRNFYFVRLDGTTPPDWHDRLIAVRSDDANDKDAKMPWKELKLTGRVHSQFLFRTALARNMIPFAQLALPLVLLPLKVEKSQSPEGQALKRFKLLDHKAIQELGRLETARWFKEVERIWIANRTETNATITSTDYLNWQHKLTDQNLDKRFSVLYSASAKDANAFVYERGTFDLEYVVDKAAYVFYTDSQQEAYYLTAFLNANSANDLMKPFQSTGLFGARDVSKKILDVPFPQFKADNPAHGRLAELGRVCAGRVADYVAANALATTEYNVGRVRSEIRNHLLISELAEIDVVLAQIIG